MLIFVSIGFFSDNNTQSYSPEVTKSKCEELADEIKNLDYITSHNNDDQSKYEMDRWRTEEQVKKFELEKCDNSLLIDNSWNPLTDGTIKP